MAKLDSAVDMNIDTGGLEPLLSEVIKLFDTSDQISRGFKKLFHVRVNPVCRMTRLQLRFWCCSLDVTYLPGRDC
jgi:hypothetical protein